MKVRIFVDGKEVPLNKFVNDIIGEIIAGAIKTLKGVNRDWNTINIEIKKD